MSPLSCRVTQHSRVKVLKGHSQESSSKQFALVAFNMQMRLLQAGHSALLFVARSAVLLSITSCHSCSNCVGAVLEPVWAPLYLLHFRLSAT